MGQSQPNKRPYPKREDLPITHQPDLDGRTDYGRDQENLPGIRRQSFRPN